MAVNRSLVVVLGVAAAVALAGLAAALIVFTGGEPTAPQQQQQQVAQPPSAPQPQKQALASAPATAAAPAPAAPINAVRTETTAYDSWTVTCRDTLGGRGDKTCSAAFKVVDQKRGAVLFQWFITKDKEGGLHTVLQTPTGVLIQKGVELKLGPSQPRTLNYVACEPSGCESAIAMDTAMIKDSLAAADAVATIYAMDGRTINFNMPVKGLDQALKAVGL